LNKTEGEVLKDESNLKRKAKNELLKPDSIQDPTSKDKTVTESSSNSTKFPKNLTLDDEPIKLNSTNTDD
jgi:hypothetical protein